MKVVNQNNIPHVIKKTPQNCSENIPVQVKAEKLNIGGKANFTRYVVHDGKIPVGYVNLIDTPEGVNVSFIKNFNPQKYSGFGKIADQIEVEHCLNRGLKKFEITSEASLNSHAYHYKRGKRFAPIKDKKTQNKLLEMFKTYDVNKIVELIIKYTPAGKSYNTSFLNKIPMFMPQSLIKKYIEIIKKHPLLK